MLQGIKLEPVDPAFDSDGDSIDKTYNKIYGTGAKFPTTAQQLGRAVASVDQTGKKIPGVNREEAQKQFKAAIDKAIKSIGIDSVMSKSQEIELDSALMKFSDDGETYIREASEQSVQMVSSISQDLQNLDPASSEVESAANDVEDILSQDELVKLENYLEDIEKDKAEGMHIPHPDFDPTDPKSPGYEETMNAEFVDMTKLKTLTEPQRLALRAAEIRKRGIETAKAKEAYRNRSPEQIVADQVKRIKDKKEKEKRILDLINTRKDMTPDQIVKVIQDEFGEDAATMTKKQTFDKIGMISLAMRSAESADDKSALKSAVATLSLIHI